MGADTSLLVFKSVDLTGYYARTSSPGVGSDTSSYRARFDYVDDRYGLAAEHMLIGRGFKPEVGYVRRNDFRRSFGLARFSPRPKRSDRIRKLTWQGSLDYVTDAAGASVQNRQARGTFVVDFQSSDQFTLDYTRDYELLPGPFSIATGVVVPAGGYEYSAAA